MRIRIHFALISAFLAAGLLYAQDAGLPPLPGQDSVAPAAVPASQVVDLSLGSPKSAKELEKQRKEEEKILKEQEKQKEKEAKEKAKELEKINKDRKKRGLPPLEATTGQEGTSVPAVENASDKKKKTKAEEKAVKEKAKELEKLNKKRKKEGLPPLDVLPGEEIAPDTTKLPGLPGRETAPAEPAPSSAAAEKPKGKPAPMKKWKQPDFGPNVIFGGYVMPKGSNLDERLAWASQEVLNTMDFNGFDFKKEKGVYAGQGGKRQWREFSFVSRRNAKAHPVTVAVEEGPGAKIFLRVGPSEPPAGVAAQEVRKMRAQNQKVLQLLKKKLKSRLTPHRRGWEAPYHRTAS